MNCYNYFVKQCFFCRKFLYLQKYFVNYDIKVNISNKL